MELLLGGSRQEALRWGLRLFDRRGARYLYEHVVTPSLHEVGDRWSYGDISVADEHIATAIVQAILAALAPQFPWSKAGPRALVGCVEGERHDLAARMMGDLLALDGWDERFLGADVPTDQFVRKARAFEPRLIAISITMREHLPALRSLVESLHEEEPSAKIIVGGLASVGLDSDEGLHVDAVADTCSSGIARAAQWKRNGNGGPHEATPTLAGQVVPGDEWTLIVAHDLRQPLNTIQIATDHLQQLRSQGISSKEQATIERIRSAVVRLNAMIDDLTSLSLLESGRMRMVPRHVDMGELVTSVVGDLGELIGGRAVRVVTRERCVAWTDPERIRRVLENLLSNGAKYGHPATDLHVEVRSDTDSVEVVVTNQGQGIPRDQLGILFEKFTRTREARESHRPGLGLGLYIAKRIVEGHGGRIWAESSPGESVSFHFTLPRSAPT